MTTPPAVLEQRRATVRQLHAAGHSNRAIARQLGVSKDAVARDLRATEPPPGEPQAAPDAPPAETAVHATSEPDRATPAPPIPTSGNPVKPWLVHDMDPRLVQDLNILIDPRTGRLPAPLERAISIAAAARRAAWRGSESSQARDDRATASQGGAR